MQETKEPKKRIFKTKANIKRTAFDSKIYYSRKPKLKNKSLSKKECICAPINVSSDIIEPISPLKVKLLQGGVFNDQNNDLIETDIIQVIKDIYPLVAKYIKRFENKLTTKHLIPFEFYSWIIESIDIWMYESKLTYKLIFNEEKKYVLYIYNEDETYCQGHSTDLYWIENLPKKEKFYFYSVLHHLHYKTNIPFYFWGSSLSDDLDMALEYLNTEIEDDYDDEDRINELKFVNEEYTTGNAIIIAQKINKGYFPLVKLKDYSNNNTDKLSDIIKISIDLIDNKFSLSDYLPVYSDHDEYPVRLEQYMQLAYKIDDSCPIWNMIEQQVDEQWGNSGCEIPTTSILFNGNNLDDLQGFALLDQYIKLLNLIYEFSK